MTALDAPSQSALGSSAVEDPNRKPEDVAAAVAGWVARGGAFMNYYMYLPRTIIVTHCS